jgi:hypothetical protein
MSPSLHLNNESADSCSKPSLPRPEVSGTATRTLNVTSHRNLQMFYWGGFCMKALIPGLILPP